MKLKNPTYLLKKYPLAVIFSVAILCIIGVIYSNSGRLNDLKNEYALIDRKVELMHQNTVNSVGLSEDLAAVKELYQGIQSKLMDPNNRAINLRYLYGLEDTAKVAMDNPIQGEIIPFDHKNAKKGTSNSKKKKEALPPYSIIRFKIAASGDYHNMLQLLYLVRTGQHFTRFNSLELRTAGNLDFNDVNLNSVIEVLSKPK